MVPSLQVLFLRIGAINTGLKSGTFNRGNLFRMLLFKGSTEAIGQRFWMQGSSII